MGNVTITTAEFERLVRASERLRLIRAYWQKGSRLYQEVVFNAILAEEEIVKAAEPETEPEDA